MITMEAQMSNEESRIPEAPPERRCYWRYDNGIRCQAWKVEALMHCPYHTYRHELNHALDESEPVAI